MSFRAAATSSSFPSFYFEWRRREREELAKQVVKFGDSLMAQKSSNSLIIAQWSVFLHFCLKILTHFRSFWIPFLSMNIATNMGLQDHCVLSMKKVKLLIVIHFLRGENYGVHFIVWWWSRWSLALTFHHFFLIMKSGLENINSNSPLIKAWDWCLQTEVHFLIDYFFDQVF